MAVTKNRRNQQELSQAEPDVENIETLFEYLLGPEINKQVTILMHGRGISKLEGFRRSLKDAFENGGFQVQHNPEFPRNGDDENKLRGSYRRVLDLIGSDLMVRLLDHARPARMTNAATLRLGVKGALDRWAF